MEEFYDAFFDLSSDRQLGMSVGPLPYSSIQRHVEGWPDDDAWSFEFCMRKMDEAYFEKLEDAPDPEFAESSNPARDAFRARFR